MADHDQEMTRARDLQDDLRELAAHYSQLASRHGDSPLTGQWADSETQEARLKILCDFVQESDAKVLDLGCGTGQMLDVLRRDRGFEGEYVGYDLSPEVVEVAERRFPSLRFEIRNILIDGVTEDFDYILMSGIFNNRMHDNWKLMTTILELVFPRARRTVAFNALSRYVDYMEADLYYVDPGEVFRFCKEKLSPLVVLRHDYCVRPGVIPFEFTLGIHVTDVPPRRLAD